MLTGIGEIRFILIQINTSIILGHRFKKANTLILRYRLSFFLLLFRCSVNTTFPIVADITFGML